MRKFNDRERAYVREIGLSLAVKIYRFNEVMLKSPDYTMIQERSENDICVDCGATLYVGGTAYGMVAEYTTKAGSQRRDTSRSVCEECMEKSIDGIINTFFPMPEGWFNNA